MQFPEVEIRSEDPLPAACERVERAFLLLGCPLHAFDHLNAEFPTAQSCRFYQTSDGQHEYILVVTVGGWTDERVLAVLNILLNIRMDPDPPGQTPRIRFYGPERVPGVLAALFGDSTASQFECRAALVAQFGNDIKPGQSLQFAAVAIHLLRECFGVVSSFYDADCPTKIEAVLMGQFSKESFGPDASPLNSLLALGFLYGESLRGKASRPSRWAILKDSGPWPVLIFGLDPSQGVAPDSPPETIPQVVFNPIASLVHAYQSATGGVLEAARASLEVACAKELEGSSGGV
jgi:hypothetical protein